ncbi:hypothetical protein HU200_039802 [Digitaria exilis]|uniref:RING-type domain-containing protein n=1 Tax=Digitaria exilis TaxID=1010633 RepID=A0A835B774_9POAL|nr:hypothetical protein HU200_039802 [Digitaria exilis]
MAGGNAAAAAAAACESSHEGENHHAVQVLKALPTGSGGQLDHHVVVDVDRLVANVVVVAGGAAAAGSPNAVDIKTSNEDPDGKNRCVVCKQNMKWVTIGGCGHRHVCNKCMVQERFFQQNKCCRICKTHCPKVLVTKADRAATTAISNLPRFAFRDGRVGNYWYHRHTTAISKPQGPNARV